jgi:GntR family transcriptional repressor for pyruvate dehydrogenase complex
LRDQHLKVWDAIRKRQPDAARQAMEEHIEFTRAELARLDGTKPRPLHAK